MNPHFKVGILLAVAAADVVLLTCLSSRRGRISRSRHGRFFLWAVSALYFPLISYILTYLTNDLSTSLAKESCIHREGKTESYMKMQEHDCLEEAVGMFMLTVLVQSLKSKADLAALAVAAVASPAAGADDIDSQKIRPSMDSLVYSFWVAGLVINTMRLYGHTEAYVDLLFESVLVLFLFWVLGAGRMVLTFAAFRHANGSFALGRNAQLIDGYMAQFQDMEEEAVPRLIVTGERNDDVEESLQGYRVKPSALEEESSRLVTLDKVWSSDDHRLHPQLKDLCLSFCLFKCLRRRFAGYKLAEAGSTWAFRFVSDGLLGENEEHNHERMFQVIAHELSFASDFYYSPLPLASLGAWPAALHFILSSFICAPLFIILLLPIPHVLFEIFVSVGKSPWKDYGDYGVVASFFPTRSNYLIFRITLILLATVDASMEICAMVTIVRSEWTKISMVAHCINKSRWSWMISTCLLRCKSPMHWKDEIGQSLLLMPCPPQHHHRLFNFKQTFLSRKNKHVNVSSDVKAAVIRSLRLGGRHLSNGIATVQRRCPQLSWACHGCVTTSTDAILVWHIATSLFEFKYPSSDSTNMAVASSLSRYCMYLVAEAPELLPDNAVRTKVRCRQVKDCVQTSMRGAASGPDLYSQLVAFESVRDERSPEAKVVKQGIKLGKQLVEEVERQNEEDEAENQQESAKRKEEMWELLAEFWSEMILYLAPSDNVKGHIEALQRGGELITLLWTLLLHAGITTRPSPHEAPAP